MKENRESSSHRYRIKKTSQANGESFFFVQKREKSNYFIREFLCIGAEWHHVCCHHSIELAEENIKGSIKIDEANYNARIIKTEYL